MGYEKIKELISDIDEYHNEAELREILQQILFICEDNLKKEPSTDNQIEKQMIRKNIYINTFYLYFNIESQKGQEKMSNLYQLTNNYETVYLP